MKEFNVFKGFGNPKQEEEDYFETVKNDNKLKWHDVYKLEGLKKNSSGSSDFTATSCKVEAQHILEDEIKRYQTKLDKASKTSDEGWLKIVLQKGTAKDKIAALILSVQTYPIQNLSALESLVGMVKVSKKNICLSVMDNLAQLLVEDVLPPGKKLRRWDQLPFSCLSAEGLGGVSRRSLLASWLFETRLKEVYSQLIQALDLVSKDTVDSNREKAVSIMYKLLSGHPEQEEVLLRNLVNKMGDINAKVASKVIYCLTQLLRIHPNMKQVVMNEVEKLLFRPNIMVRTQYYAICFLSQFIFTLDEDDTPKNIIKIYLSFFKASIKKGEVNSRLMGALLMGVKRAFPYARMDSASMDEHMNELYKLVHMSTFNIALHTLCLLEQVSANCEDRFYCALYKKLLDPKLRSTTYQAMFINLLFKALVKDQNLQRVSAILKRLLQVSLHLPSAFLCGVLYMVSQLLYNKSPLRLFEVKASQISSFIEDESDEETYVDADKMAEESESKKNEKTDKKNFGWNFVAMSKKKDKTGLYDWRARNPSFCHVESTAYYELLALANHYHPSVSLFARKIMNNELIVYTGDPLMDFTLVRFLERFIFKNPKKSLEIDETKGPDPKLAHRRFYRPTGNKAVNVTSNHYLAQEEHRVPEDELFLYRYLKEKQVQRPRKNIIKEDEADSDADSVTSEDFHEMLDSMVGKKGKHDYMEDIGDQLKPAKGKAAKKKALEEELEEVDSDSSEPSEGEEDEDDSFIEDGDEDDDEEEAIDFDDEDDSGSDIFDDEGLPKEKGKKKGKKNLGELFMSAEKFSEMLEDGGGSKSGMAHTFTNLDNAPPKQLNWEADRDRWIRGADKRKRKFPQKEKFRKKFKK